MSKTKTKQPKCGRVTHVSVSRLFNLGNYCNRKIDVSAEVAPGQSATDTLSNLWWIVEQLAPIRKPSCFDDFHTAIKKPAEKQSEWEKGHLDEWSEAVKAYSTRVALRAEALTLLDDLGGATKHTDHKEKWQNDDMPF